MENYGVPADAENKSSFGIDVLITMTGVAKHEGREAAGRRRYVHPVFPVGGAGGSGCVFGGGQPVGTSNSTVVSAGRREVFPPAGKKYGALTETNPSRRTVNRRIPDWFAHVWFAESPP